MTDKFPAVNSKQVIVILNKLGFEKTRETGSSHVMYKNFSDGRRTFVPRHGTTILKRKTLKSILNDIHLTLEEFKKLL